MDEKLDKCVGTYVVFGYCVWYTADKVPLN